MYRCDKTNQDNRSEIEHIKEVSTVAVPKRKTSQAKTSGRKAANMKKSMTGLSICPQCHEPKLPHRVCPTCGYYDGKDVVNAE